MQRRDRKRIEKLKRRKTELIRRLEYCEYHKKKISNFVKELNGQYKHGLISYEKYCKRLDRTLKQRTLEQWISYYNDWIKHYNKDLRVCEREIREEKKAPDIVPVIAVITMLLLLGISVVFIKPSILGSVVYEPGYEGIVNFDRIVDCDKCGQHKAPPLTDVNMTISAIFRGITNNDVFTDYYEKTWEVIDSNGGSIESYNDTYNKISWIVSDDEGVVSRSYIIRSPELTIPPVDYYFQSELSGAKSDLWIIKVADADGRLTISYNTPNQTSVMNGKKIEVEVYGTCDNGGSESFEVWLEDDSNLINTTCSGTDFIYVSNVQNVCAAGGGCTINSAGTVSVVNCRNDAINFTWTVQACNVDSANNIAANANSTTSGLFTAASAVNVEITAPPLNNPPTIDQTAPATPDTILEPNNESFSINVSDAEADTLDISWYWDSVWIKSDSSVNLDSNYSEFNFTGNYTVNNTVTADATFNISANVSDGTVEAWYEWALTVTNTNRPPVIAETSTTPITIDEPDNVTFDANITEEDDQSLDVSWYWNEVFVTSENISLTGNETQLNFTGNFTSNGVYNISMNVTDLDNETRWFNWDLTVNNNNTIPIVDSFAPNDDPSVAEPNNETFSINITDVDDDTVFNLSWYFDTNFQSSDTDLNYSEWNFTGNFTSANTYNISVNFSDGINVDWKNWTFTVSDTAETSSPVILDITDISSQSITEDGVTNITFYVQAEDVNGVGELVDTDMNATFTLEGQEQRINMSCLWLEDINTTAANYSCTIGIYYWDQAGSWAVNTTIMDDGNLASADYSENFDLGSTTTIMMAPVNMTWATLYAGQTNLLSLDNPIVINNTGNFNITNINVNASDLFGEDDDTKWIESSNFTVNINNACEGTQLVNSTATQVTSAYLDPGNNSINDGSTGQEQLYFCLEEVPFAIGTQQYSTIKGGAWIIEVS